MLVLASLALAVVFQASIERIWLSQSVDAQLVTHKWTAFADQVRGTVKACCFVRVDNALRVVCIDFDEIVAAILPRRFFCAAGLGRARVIHPAIIFIGLMNMAQRQVICVRAQRLELCYSR